ncbi:MAG: BamA/TamA family outer membrane protein [Bacteroidota bacterium]
MEVQAYKWGKNGVFGLWPYDSLGVAEDLNRITEKYNRKIEKASKENRISRLKARLIGKTEKKNKKLREGNLLMRWGSPPTIFDSTQVATSISNIEQYLFSRGYFNTSVTTKITHPKKHRTNIKYDIFQENAYYIDSVIYAIADEKARELVLSYHEKNLLMNTRYDQDNITRERERIFELFANNGYFDFKRQYIHFGIDSTSRKDNFLIVKETIFNPPNADSHKIFTIDSVIFDANISNTDNSLIKNYRGITYDFAEDKYNTKILDWRMFVYPDSLFRRSSTLQTQKQLSYLDMFKFVNINYDSTDGKFVGTIFISPLEKYQTSSEVGLSVTDQAQIPGPFISFNLKNRNIFKGMEILELNGNAGIQGLSGVSSLETQYSRLQYGGEFSLTFPQFLFPLGKYYKSKIGQYNPKTKLTTGINFEDRREEYKRQTFNTSLSYIWQVKDNSQFTLKPFDVSYIDSELSTKFSDSLSVYEQQGNLSYSRAFRPAFVSSSSFSMELNMNNYGLSYRDAAFVRANIETGGSLESIFGKDPFGTQLEYYKYAKSDIDFRQTFKMNSLTEVAYRAHVGLAISYGQNRALPYEKYYFAGGSNSIRAWRPRRLGPGAFGVDDSTDPSETKINYNREQPGDIIIETSFEYRRKLLKYVNGAIFVDAGNVWLLNSSTVTPANDPEGDDGIFRLNSFLSEFAVGSGIGLRIDFSFLILRLDGAWKLFNPAYPKGKRFVGNELNFGNLFDFRNNTFNINIGIGYPF